MINVPLAAEEITSTIADLEERASAATSAEELDRILLTDLPAIIWKAKSASDTSLRHQHEIVVRRLYRLPHHLRHLQAPVNDAVTAALANPAVSLAQVSMMAEHILTPNDDVDDQYLQAAKSNPALIFWWASQEPGFMRAAASVYCSMNKSNPLVALRNEERPVVDRDLFPHHGQAFYNAMGQSFIPGVLGIEGIALPPYDERDSDAVQMALMPLRERADEMLVFGPLTLILTGSSGWFDRLLSLSKRTLDHSDAYAGREMRREHTFSRWVVSYVNFVHVLARELGRPMPSHLLDQVMT